LLKTQLANIKTYANPREAMPARSRPPAAKSREFSGFSLDFARKIRYSARAILMDMSPRSTGGKCAIFTEITQELLPRAHCFGEKRVSLRILRDGVLTQFP
jgi:hypothetical protein